MYAEARAPERQARQSGAKFKTGVTEGLDFCPAPTLELSALRTFGGGRRDQHPQPLGLRAVRMRRDERLCAGRS